jgi:hypothetical protein
MRVRHLLPALLLVLLAAAPAPAGETGSILGRVFDGETLRPVRYAYVTVATAKGLELGTAGTDRDGRFRLDDVPAGFHRLVGWRGAEGSDPLPEIAVLPGEEVRHVELVLVPRAVVRLRVETPSGREPDLEWCVLEARADQPRDGPPPRRRLVKAVRRATGSLELRAEAGAWDLVVHAKGLRTHVLPLVLEEFERRFVTVELSPGVSVLGRVLDRDGEPVGGAVVQRLRLDAPRAEGATWTADATGRFDLAGAAAAPTRFRVKAFGFRERIVTLPLDRAGFIYRRDLILERLPAAAGGIAGRVEDADGKGVTGVRVLLEERSTVTDTGGGFRFEDLPDDELVLRLDDPEGELLESVLRVRPGASALRLAHRRRPVLVVRPRYPDGRAPALWRARVQGPDNRRVAIHAETAAEARFVLSAPGTVTVRMEVPGHPTPDALVTQLRADETVTVDVPVSPVRRTGTIAGWIVSRDDVPLDVGFTATVTGPDGVAKRLATDALGGFVLRRLAGGEYVLRIRREGRADDAAAPESRFTLEDGGRLARTVRVDAAMVVAEDEGEGEGPLQIGDGLTWAAGTRLETRADLQDNLDWFGDRPMEIEVVRSGKVLRFRTPASGLKRYVLVPSLR